jgi:hypothetical protein
MRRIIRWRIIAKRLFSFYFLLDRILSHRCLVVVFFVEVILKIFHQGFRKGLHKHSIFVEDSCLLVVRFSVFENEVKVMVKRFFCFVFSRV